MSKKEIEIDDTVTINICPKKYKGNDYPGLEGCRGIVRKKKKNGKHEIEIPALANCCYNFSKDEFTVDSVADTKLLKKSKRHRGRKYKAKIGDRVLVTDKESKYYGKIGRVCNAKKGGKICQLNFSDCLVSYKSTYNLSADNDLMKNTDYPDTAMTRTEALKQAQAKDPKISHISMRENGVWKFHRKVKGISKNGYTASYSIAVTVEIKHESRWQDSILPKVAIEIPKVFTKNVLKIPGIKHKFHLTEKDDITFGSRLLTANQVKKFIDWYIAKTEGLDS